jgi:hypothetical protein
MPALRVERAECCDIGNDDDVPGHAGERSSFRVDDRAARTDQVDGAVGLAVRERCVGGSVEDLDRPGT